MTQQGKYTETQKEILRSLKANNGYALSYAYLEEDTNFTIQTLKKEMKTLREMGIVKFCKGLIDDDGRACGSGHSLKYMNSIEEDEFKIAISLLPEPTSKEPVDAKVEWEKDLKHDIEYSFGGVEEKLTDSQGIIFEFCKYQIDNAVKACQAKYHDEMEDLVSTANEIRALAIKNERQRCMEIINNCFNNQAQKDKAIQSLHDEGKGEQI